MRLCCPLSPVLPCAPKFQCFHWVLLDIYFLESWYSRRALRRAYKLIDVIAVVQHICTISILGEACYIANLEHSTGVELSLVLNWEQFWILSRVLYIPQMAKLCDKCYCYFLLLELYSDQHWRSTAMCTAALGLPNL